MAIRVLLVDDHTILRDGVHLLLESQGDMEVVGEAANGRSAVRLAKELSPDVVVMDVTMPDLNGIEATRQILAASPGTRVLALSQHTDRRFLADMLKAGAVGYLLKTSCGRELVGGDRIRGVIEVRLELARDALEDSWIAAILDQESL